MTRPGLLSLPLLPLRRLRSALAGADFERAGLLDGLDHDARAARRAILDTLDREGVAVEEMAEAVAEDRLDMLLLERTLAPDGHYDAKEVARLAGLDVDVLRRWFRALGHWSTDGSPRLYGEADVDLARRLREYRDLGLSEERMLTVVRVVGRGLANLADAAGGMLGEALLGAQDQEGELALRFAVEMRRLAEDDVAMLSHVLAGHLSERIRSHAVDIAGQRGRRLQGAQDVAVCFADIVGFTELGEEIAADELGRVAERLDALATDLIEPPVRLISTIGDAVMLVAPHSAELVRTAVDLIETARTEHEQLPALRAGIASGVAVASGGDWYGPPVNLASRITAIARPNSVLATAEVRDTVGDGDGALSWRAVGRKQFKGVREGQRLYRVQRLQE